MGYGKEQHIRWEELEKRRTFKKYKLQDAEREFNVSVKSDRLGLYGKLDLLIKTPFEYIPAEFKYTEGKISMGHRYQVIAYALLIEDFYHVTVRTGR
jgi:CRISPR-associated exonuclease Cas4